MATIEPHLPSLLVAQRVETPACGVVPDLPPSMLLHRNPAGRQAGNEPSMSRNPQQAMQNIKEPSTSKIQRTLNKPHKNNKVYNNLSRTLNNNRNPRQETLDKRIKEPSTNPGPGIRNPQQALSRNPRQTLAMNPQQVKEPSTSLSENKHTHSSSG